MKRSQPDDSSDSQDVASKLNKVKLSSKEHFAKQLEELQEKELRTVVTDLFDISEELTVQQAASSGASCRMEACDRETAA